MSASAKPPHSTQPTYSTSPAYRPSPSFAAVEQPNAVAPTSCLLGDLSSANATLFFGLNFKYTEVDKKGLLNRLRRKTQALDLDLSCVLYDNKLQLIDTIWFKQLRDSQYAIRHHGDSLNGNDRGDLAKLDRYTDVETIELRLAQVSAKVAHVVLLVSAYRDYPINRVQRGHLHISDDEGNELYSQDLTQLDKDSSAILVATLSREFSDWRFRVNNLMLTSADMDSMRQQAQQELARLFA